MKSSLTFYRFISLINRTLDFLYASQSKFDSETIAPNGYCGSDGIVIKLMVVINPLTTNVPLI